MKKKKRKVNVKRVAILIILLALIIAGAILTISKLTHKESNTKEIKEVASIDAYGYTLKDTATAYYKKLFKELEKTLNEKEVDKDKYAELVAQMFIADFFNLDNKISKNDVGGKEFVYSDYQSDFEKFAMDSMYKSVESDVYGERNQELPEVTNVKVTKVKNETYQYGENTDENAYVFNFSIEYKEDMDYQTEGSLILIHNGNKIEVASMSEKSASE